MKGAANIDVRVVPRASRSEIVGLVDNILKVRISAPPVNNAANSELIKLLSKTLGVPKTSIAIVAGHNSRSKRLRISGISETLLKARLSA